MNSDLPSHPASLVGGRVRPRCLFADPFSSPSASHGEVPEADNEAIPMAPSKQRCSYVLDDGPCSEIHPEDLMAIRRRYAIHSSRLLTELFLLRNRVRDMAAQHDLLIRQVTASARWKLMKEWLEGRTEHWDPEEEYRQLLGRHSGRFSQVSLRSVAESRVSAGPLF
ncbi:hypothetical protein Bca52824_054145 [Brassica carinata]|uniref:Uncharacterized protein n=1 Tax=Brassica carinata TaxID=52824 RepID=A0A8X7R9C3_BRACI|nr:hypothetical protein Bca52824_054145 [Brassica carinata]